MLAVLHLDYEVPGTAFAFPRDFLYKVTKWLSIASFIGNMGTPTACLDILFLFAKHFETLRMKAQIVSSIDIHY